MSVCSSYMHFHSLNRTLRAVAAIIRMVVNMVCRHSIHTSIWRACCTSTNTWCWLLAIIKCLYHPSCIWTCFWQQEIVLEDSIIIGSNTTVDYLWSIILQVLHESRLCIIHQVILVGRSSLIFRIIKPGSRRVRIRVKIVHVYILIDKTAITIARIIKWSIWVTTNRATSIWKLSSCVLLIWFVKRVGVVVSCLLSTTTDGCMVTSVAVYHVTATGTHRCEVTDVQRSMTLSISTVNIAMYRLFSSMMSTSMMEPSLIELVSSNLAKCILIFSCTYSKVVTIALVDWVASPSWSSLLS